MKKWYLVEDFKDEFVTELNVTDYEDAFLEVSHEWGRMSKHERESCDGFYLALAEVDEDDNYEFDWEDVVESCNIKNVKVGDIFDDPMGHWEITEINGAEVSAIDESDGNECCETIAEAAYFIRYGLKNY